MEFHFITVHLLLKCLIKLFKINSQKQLWYILFRITKLINILAQYFTNTIPEKNTSLIHCTCVFSFLVYWSLICNFILIPYSTSIYKFYWSVFIRQFKIKSLKNDILFRNTKLINILSDYKFTCNNLADCIRDAIKPGLCLAIHLRLALSFFLTGEKKKSLICLDKNSSATFCK